MSVRDGPIGDMKLPLRWTAAVALFLALAAALALLLGDRRGSPRGEPLGPLRAAADRLVAPAGDVLSAPIRWVDAGAGSVADYLAAGRQNQAMKRELAGERRWRDVAVALGLENARYRALMGVKTDPPIPMVFARTVIDSRGPFANTRLADAGAAKGVIEGNPVLSEHGLVGRVTGVGQDVSRIILLTDPESRTPVLVARTNARAILTGDGGANPRLAYLRTHEAMREGDVVMTSGDGGVFPRGLPVGVAAKGYDGAWRVVLDADASPIDYVRILLFKDFSQLIAAGDLAPSRLPSAMTEEASPTILGPAAPPAKTPTPPLVGKVAPLARAKKIPAPPMAKAQAPAATKPAAKTASPPSQTQAAKPATKKPATKSAAAKRPPPTIADLLDRP